MVANGWSPKVVAFNHDASALFFGTISNSGRVYRVDLDANMNPVSPPTLIGSTPGSWHDGLGVDICGNVYIAEYNNRSLYRIGVTSNQLQTVYAPSNDKYGHGLVWGTGSGGWNDHALYLPQPYNGNTVVEIDIGVPPAGYPATPTGISPI